jgi:hypothetical protein
MIHLQYFFADELGRLASRPKKILKQYPAINPESFPFQLLEFSAINFLTYLPIYSSTYQLIIFSTHPDYSISSNLTSG